MNVQSFAFETASDLKMAAKRYTTSNLKDSQCGLTLLFMHCIGSHKEQWEPIIETLFERQRKEGACYLREAWAFDWQSHGDSAVLNREALKSCTDAVYEWTKALAEFVKSRLATGHRIVPLGHSAGAAVSILLTKMIPLEKFASLVLIEPTLSTKAIFDARREDRMAAIDFTVAATNTRRDHWLSKEQAFAYFKKRIPWEFWDERVIRLMTEYGLEDSPSGGVKLKWDKKLEAVSYMDTDPHFEGAIQLGRVCHSIPIHVIWGIRQDIVPDFIRDSLNDFSEGRTLASVTEIENAGHMVVQEQPDLVAIAIAGILQSISNVAKARL